MDRESQESRRMERGKCDAHGLKWVLLRRGRKKQEQFPKGQRHE
jgi:hypothetical protein